LDLPHAKGAIHVEAMKWRNVMVLAVAALSVGTGSALAGCTDPGEPGVNWQRCYFERQDLRDIRLNKAKLRDASFVRAVLTGADLSGVDAFRAKFISPKLAGAIFDGARLLEADFTKADLSKTSFRNTDLRRAKLFRVNLRGADLTGARMRGADFHYAELT
jgi:uncharacterized protein YjbI with pentapeptide repeats